VIVRPSDEEPSYTDNAMDYRERIVVDPEILVGKPVVKGTRIAVALVLRLLALGMEQAEILDEYPRLTPEDIRACLAYAEAVISGEDVFPATPAA
jgi:uncharacterized protein (DUF433 family)